MGFWEFLFGIVVVLLVAAFGVGGLAIWGVAKLVQHVTKRLPGARKQPERLNSAPRPKASTQTNPRRTQAKAQPKAQAQEHPEQSRPMHTYEYLDVDAGADAEAITRVMRSYEQERVTGFYAHEVIDMLAMMELRRKSLFSQINSEFEPGTISWDRFATTANKALDAILRNCALLANRVQAFDVDDYERMEQFYRTGAELRNGKQDPARIQRWELLRETKDEMDGIRSANEGLMLELGKLASELGKLSHDEFASDSAQIAEEVSRLVEETKYYN